MITVTAKNQITIPAKIAKKLSIKKGEKLALELKNGSIILTPRKSPLDSLAGSIEKPKKLKDKSIEEIINEARMEYFKR